MAKMPRPTSTRKYFWSTFFLVLVSAALISSGYYFLGWGGVALGLGVAFLFSLFAYALMLNDEPLHVVYDVRKPKSAEELEFAELFATYSARSRIPVPPLYIVKAAQANAIAAGNSKSHHAAAVSTALFTRVTPAARAAIAAHLAARFRNSDLTRRAWITSFAGFFVELLTHAPWWELGAGTGLLLALVVVFGALIGVTYMATFIEAWWLRRYEFRTDRRAAVLCGDRRNLIEALETVERDVAKDHWANRAGRGEVRELFFVDPKAIDAYAPFQPPVAIRVVALRRSRGAVG